MSIRANEQAGEQAGKLAIKKLIIWNKCGLCPGLRPKTRKPSIELAYGEMQYAIALEMKYERLRCSHSLAEAAVLQKQFTTALSSCCAYQSNVV